MSSLTGTRVLNAGPREPTGRMWQAHLKHRLTWRISVTFDSSLSVSFSSSGTPRPSPVPPRPPPPAPHHRSSPCIKLHPPPTGRRSVCLGAALCCPWRPPGRRWRRPRPVHCQLKPADAPADGRASAAPGRLPPVRRVCLSSAARRAVPSRAAHR